MRECAGDRGDQTVVSAVRMVRGGVVEGRLFGAQALCGRSPVQIEDFCGTFIPGSMSRSPFSPLDIIEVTGPFCRWDSHHWKTQFSP